MELPQLRLLTICVQVLGLILVRKTRAFGLVSFIIIIAEVVNLRLGF